MKRLLPLIGLAAATLALTIPLGSAAAGSSCALGGCAEVSGSTLLRDGKPWVPKGVQLVAFVAPPGSLKGGYVAAHEHFGQAEMDAAKSFGADTIRFQASHPGLDPQSPLHTKSYLDSLMNAVHLARKNGFTVIVSVQDQPQSGETTPRTLPDDATFALWREFAPKYSSDTGVMFELFNEPFRAATPKNWPIWQDAMQRTIDAIRSTGSRNVIIVDGLGMAHNLENAPPLNDSTGQLAYAVHPYLWKFYTKPASWDMHFGDFSQSHVVIATEWNAEASNLKLCTPDLPNVAANLVSYLKQHRIGIVGFAFDMPHTLIKDFWTPTSYQNFACGAPDEGVGELLSRTFHGG